MPRIESSTSLFGVVGWPLQHTLSPRLHNAAFTALGLDAAYVPLRVEPSRSRRLLESLDTLGFQGANVTSPHKEAAFRACGWASPAARAARSVNTLRRVEAGWEGHTTDGAGLVGFLHGEGLDPRRCAITLLGGGGAARSSAVALAALPGVRLRVVSRNPRSAAKGLEGLEELGAGSSVEFLKRGSAGSERAVRSARLVLNATRLGQVSGDELPCPGEWVSEGAAAVDFVYGRMTPWRRALRKRGRLAYSGLGLLVHQAALSFRLWTGRNPLEWMLWTADWEAERDASGGGEAASKLGGRTARRNVRAASVRRLPG